MGRGGWRLFLSSFLFSLSLSMGGEEREGVVGLRRREEGERGKRGEFVYSSSLFPSLLHKYNTKILDAYL